MPSAVFGLSGQPSLEDTDSINISTGRDGVGYASFAVSITYTLWRNPTDRLDPVNLAVLDDKRRTAIERASRSSGPPWLHSYVQRMRYPQLWEAVRTTWNRDLPADTSLVRELVDHANHVLMNQYRDESVPEQQSGIEPGVAEEFADLAGTVTVDGIPVPAA